MSAISLLGLYLRTSLCQRHNSIASIDCVSLCVSEALQQYASAISLFVLYLRTSLYKRHNSIASQLKSEDIYLKRKLDEYKRPNVTVEEKSHGQ